ncbi:MAG: TetR/AcrR family transcriptional regulator [Acidimicrobiia bacterium]
MPRLWNETIEAHRHEVEQAIMDTTAELVGKQGLSSVTMSQIASQTGIGRATLYKYFPNVDTILSTWHQRQINGHLAQLVNVRDQAADPGKLEAVLLGYALIFRQSRHHRNSGLAAFLHRDHQVASAKRKLHTMIRDLVSAAAEAGVVRGDIAPDELASYCIEAITAASSMPSKTAVRRLVTVILAGLEPED